MALWFPSGLAIIAWFFVSPPSYRFAWGPLIVFAAAPLVSVLSTAQAKDGRSVTLVRWFPRLAAATVIALVIFSIVVRTDFASMTDERTWGIGQVSIPYTVAPPPIVSTSTLVTEGGVDVQVPTIGDQCWDVYPLCSPLPTPSLSFQGEGLGSGFTS